MCVCKREKERVREMKREREREIEPPHCVKERLSYFKTYLTHSLKLFFDFKK